MNKRSFTRQTMFTRNPSNLDRAIVLSIALMVAFNLAVLGSQQGAAPQVALTHSAATQG
jgi:hypothetical protein